MHDSSHAVFGRLVLRGPRAIQIPSTAADQHETGVFLGFRFLLAILADKVVPSQLGSVHDPIDIDFDDFEVWFLGSFRVIGEDIVILGDACVGHDVVNAAVCGERLRLFKQIDLFFPGSGVALNEFGTISTKTTVSTVVNGQEPSDSPG